MSKGLLLKDLLEEFLLEIKLMNLFHQLGSTLKMGIRKQEI